MSDYAPKCQGSFEGLCTAYAELEAENARLRDLVADAYDEGFEDATRCGHGWSASEAKKALGVSDDQSRND